MLQMVVILNNYYKMFDESMSKYQVYKINSVNDSHMIVSGDYLSGLKSIKHCITSGLPPSDGDYHVTNIAGMALNIQAK